MKYQYLRDFVMQCQLKNCSPERRVWLQPCLWTVERASKLEPVMVRISVEKQIIVRTEPLPCQLWKRERNRNWSSRTSSVWVIAGRPTQVVEGIWVRERDGRKTFVSASLFSLSWYRNHGLGNYGVVGLEDNTASHSPGGSGAAAFTLARATYGAPPAAE